MSHIKTCLAAFRTARRIKRCFYSAMQLLCYAGNGRSHTRHSQQALWLYMQALMLYVQPLWLYVRLMSLYSQPLWLYMQPLWLYVQAVCLYAQPLWLYVQPLLCSLDRYMQPPVAVCSLCGFMQLCGYVCNPCGCICSPCACICSPCEPL